MGSFLLAFFTVILVLLSLFMVLVILMQRPSSNGGMGSAMGGGAMESAFGAASGNILTKTTIYCAVAFFLIVFGLYLGYMRESNSADNKANYILPEAGTISASETTDSTENKEVTEEAPTE